MWFNKNKANPAGPVTRPLSFENVQSVFVKNDWPHTINEADQVLMTHAEGIISNIFAVEFGIFIMRDWPLEWLTDERFAEVLAWAEDFNNNNPFPTVTVYQVDGTWFLSAGFLIPNNWEYSDGQLSEWLKCGIFGVMDVGQAFFPAFNLENPDKKFQS